MQATFLSYVDFNGDHSRQIPFVDRLGRGAAAIQDRPPSLNAGHLNTDQLAEQGQDYADYTQALGSGAYGGLDFEEMADAIGRNTGNQRNSPYFVRMVSGLGTGLFLMDADGCPLNTLDEHPDRPGCAGRAPAEVFDADDVACDLDRLVTDDGLLTGSWATPYLLRDRADAPHIQRLAASALLAGPLSIGVARRLADPETGLVLDAWFDADGQPQGHAAELLR